MLRRLSKSSPSGRTGRACTTGFKLGPRRSSLPIQRSHKPLAAQVHSHRPPAARPRARLPLAFASALLAAPRPPDRAEGVSKRSDGRSCRAHARRLGLQSKQMARFVRSALQDRASVRTAHPITWQGRERGPHLAYSVLLSPLQSGRNGGRSCAHVGCHVPIVTVGAEYCRRQTTEQKGSS